MHHAVTVSADLETEDEDECNVPSGGGLMGDRTRGGSCLTATEELFFGSSLTRTDETLCQTLNITAFCLAVKNVTVKHEKHHQVKR